MEPHCGWSVSSIQNVLPLGTLMARLHPRVADMHQSLIICYACHEHVGPLSFPVWY